MVIENLTTMRADKRWAHGRVEQEISRAIHRFLPHDWSDWTIDPPENDDGVPIDPEPETVVFAYRGCINCGLVQTVLCQLQDTELLPI